MNSPIENRIGMVFVPVSDITRSIEWYSRLLNVPQHDASHGGTIYGVPMQGEVGLILDGTQPQVTASSQPLCFFWTDDILGAREFLAANGIAIIRDVENIGSISTLAFADPDGNLLMVCQRN